MSIAETARYVLEHATPAKAYGFRCNYCGQVAAHRNALGARALLVGHLRHVHAEQLQPEICINRPIKPPHKTAPPTLPPPRRPPRAVEYPEPTRVNIQNPDD
jgi:hypothetical protein